MAKKHSVEVVIPIYNEEVELEESIKKLYTYLKKSLPEYTSEITIADNASTDGSLAIAKKLAKKYANVSVLHLEEKGRGRAVKQAWKKSKADLLVYMDVDLSTDLANLKPLLYSLTHGYDVAIGSRLLPKSKVVKRPIKREVLSRGYNILIKLFFGTNFSDAQCGFKGVTKQVVKKLVPHIQDNEWFFDSEMLIMAEKMGYKIHEEPVYWEDNPGSTVRVMKTVTGDLLGLWRLFVQKPWNEVK